MKKALFISKNLIGDAMSIGPALTAWRRDHEEWQAVMLTLPDFIAEVYHRMGCRLEVVFTEPVETWDYKFYFDVGDAFKLGEQKKMNIVDAFAEMLGVTNYPAKPIFETAEDEHEKGLVLIAPFSRSCASNEGKEPNKMLRWRDWRPIVKYLRTLGPIGVLGAKNDAAPELEISEEEYFTGLPLNTAALMLRDCKLFVSIDNGMSHLAASQIAPHILFYPACLGLHWAVPWGNPNVVPLQMDPARLDTAHLITTTRRVAQMLLEKRRNDAGEGLRSLDETQGA